MRRYVCGYGSDDLMCWYSETSLDHEVMYAIRFDVMAQRMRKGMERPLIGVWTSVEKLVTFENVECTVNWCW